uniref:Uncharacterized protein n=1 Tax=Paramormyrops kingsleyae TaxID=1676925 RepID=A0A3B3Q838_9TELE
MIPTVKRGGGSDLVWGRVVPTVKLKRGGGSDLVWGCMSAAGVRELHFIDGIMHSQMHCDILKKKMRPSVHALGHRALFQHDNY